MKAKVTTLALVALVSAASTTAVLAHEDYSEGGSLHWLTHVAESKSQPSANQLAPYGYAVTGPADRVVNLDSARHLNVTRLETVQIKTGDKSITWKFDTLGTPSFPLSKAVPGFEGVTVHVEEHPSYRGG